MHATRIPSSYNTLHELPHNYFNRSIISPHQCFSLKRIFPVYFIGRMLRHFREHGLVEYYSIDPFSFYWKKITSFSRAWIGRILRHSSTTCFVLATRHSNKLAGFIIKARSFMKILLCFFKCRAHLSSLQLPPNVFTKHVT